MMDSIPHIYELASSLKWRQSDNSVAPSTPKAATEDAPNLQSKVLHLKSFYASKTRQILGQFLKRRGVAYRRNATKARMIEMLEEHDLESPDAAEGDGFQDTQDVEKGNV
jgi:hypothetical protein